MSQRPLTDLLEDIANAALGLDEAVTALADGDRGEDLGTLLGERIAAHRIDPAAVLEGSDEDAVAVLCRAAGLGINGYSAVLRMRRRAGRLGGPGPAVLLARYVRLARLSPAEAAAQLVGKDIKATG